MQRHIHYSEEMIDELISAFEDARESLSSCKLDSQAEQAMSRLEASVMAFQVTSLSAMPEQILASVAQVAQAQGKRVQVTCEGFELAVPHDIAALISLTITHAIRNAIDHGIESPDERQAKGKPANGTLEFSLSRKSAALSLSIKDDGRGLDLSKIVRVAARKNLIDESQAARLSSEEITELLFQPGFSTRESADQWSGRGVGLDAIRSSAQDLGGKAEIRQQQSGETSSGTELSLRIPLKTVAVHARRIENHPELLLPEAADHPDAKLWLFRKLDPSWRKAGPAWLKKLFELSGGELLAARESPSAGASSSGQQALFIVLCEPDWITQIKT